MSDPSPGATSSGWVGEGPRAIPPIRTVLDTTRVPDPKVPDPKVSDPNVPDPKVPEPKVPEPKVPDATVPLFEPIRVILDTALLDGDAHACAAAGAHTAHAQCTESDVLSAQKARLIREVMITPPHPPLPHPPPPPLPPNIPPPPPHPLRC